MENFGNQSKSYLSELVRQGLNSFKAIGYEKLVVTGTAAGLASIPATAKYCEMTLISTITTGAAINRLNLGSKTLPTATEGLGVANGTLLDIVDYQNIINFRAIQTAGGTHTLYVQYYS